MRDRTTLVLELIKNSKTISAVLQELAEHGWYCEGHLAIISKQDVLDVLKQFLNADITVAEITSWANAIGGRTVMLTETQTLYRNPENVYSGRP